MFGIYWLFVIGLKEEREVNFRNSVKEVLVVRFDDNEYRLWRDIKINIFFMCLVCDYKGNGNYRIKKLV